jgi:hypothetical protein
VLVGSCLQTFWNTLSVPSSRNQAVTEEYQETFTCLLHSSLTAFPDVHLELLDFWTSVKQLPNNAAKDKEE